MTDADSHAIALKAAQINAQQNVTYIRQTVVKTENEHRHAGETGNGKRILNC